MLAKGPLVDPHLLDLTDLFGLWLRLRHRALLGAVHVGKVYMGTALFVLLGLLKVELNFLLASNSFPTFLFFLLFDLWRYW